MKKLITLLILFVGMVSTASAAKLYVNTSTNASWWTNVRIYAYNSDSDNNGWDYSETGVVSSTTTLFGKEWYVFDMGNYSNAIVQYFESSNHNISNKSSEITDITHDRFIFIPGTQTDGKWVWYENGYTFRCNVLGNWDATTCNMTVVDENTLTYTLTKAEIKSSKVDKIWFRILNQEGQLYPKADGTTLDYAVGTTTYWNNWDGTSWSFGIAIPSFDYEKIVVTASLSGVTWTIKADAYITKTVNKAQKWATLGCDGAALDLSGLEAKSIMAYPLTVSSKGVISKGDAITGVLAANKGVLLETSADEDVTLSIPVSAEEGTDGSTQLVATTTGTRVEKVTETGYTNYILTEQDGHVGFYMVNNSGNSMLANTAFLHVADSYVPTEARAFFWFEDETTGIEAAKASQKMNGEFFNLAGQRVAQPTKGLYIVNGKKVIMK